MTESNVHIEVKMGSERGFGIVFFIVFFVIGLWPLINGSEPWWPAIFIGAVFLAAAAIVPKKLTLLNKLWFKFGMFLGGIIAPIVMGLVFVLTVLPTGLIMRALGKDLLRQKMDPEGESYWIKREDQVRPMTDQF